MTASNSILQSVKLYCLVPEETTIYDPQILTLINAEFNTVKQLGVGEVNGFSITGSEELWSDTGLDEPLLSAVADYIDISVRLKFDPPSNSFLVNLLKEERNEATWRITNDYSCVEETNE